MLATRPLLAATVVVPGILVLAYLWQKRRTEEANQHKDIEIPTAQSVNSVVDSKEVSLKLESLNRYRLDCIEEERSETTSEVVEEICCDIKASGDIPIESVDTKSVQFVVSEKGDSALIEDFHLSNESEAVTDKIIENQTHSLVDSFDTENCVLLQQELTEEDNDQETTAESNVDLEIIEESRDQENTADSISDQEIAEDSIKQNILEESSDQHQQDTEESSDQQVIEESCDQQATAESSEQVSTEESSDQPEETKEITCVEINHIQEATNMTTEESVETPTPPQLIPDVTSALKDPIASPLSSSPDDKVSDITSPIKSEASQKSESWSDLIDEEDELVMTDLKQNNMLNNNFKLSAEKGGDGRNDSGVASPTEEYSCRPETVSAESGGGDDKSRNSSGEDAGIGGSETGDVSDGNADLSPEDMQLFSYQFYIQDYLTGSFIGRKGESINKLKSTCSCNVIVRDDNVQYQKRSKLKSRDGKYGEGRMNLVILEGTRTNIDKCLDTIKEWFKDRPELSLEQINKPENTSLSLSAGSVALSLVEGIMHDVVISSIVYADHIFVQQPTNPTFSALERLECCMYNTYSQLTCPALQPPVTVNSICVAPSNDGWFRCQVVDYDGEEEVCSVKYVDYGGYDTIPVNQLKQIRTDFLSLPFQAIECRLANIIVPEDDTVSCTVLNELVDGQVIQARMLGVDEDNIPMVHIYRNCNGQTVMVNRELVDRSCAEWIESKFVPVPEDH